MQTGGWSRAKTSLLGLVLALVIAGAVASSRPALAAFSGTNGKIAFASSREGDFEIFTVNADGTGIANVTNTDFSGQEDSPAWSADGAKLAYVGGHNTVWTMNADGSSQTKLTPVNWIDYDPAWSPDSTRIAFTSRGTSFANPPNIWVMNANGTARAFITGGSAPSWSPDGTRIAFSADAGDGSSDIFVIAPDRSGLANLTNTPGASEFSPNWSPSGSRIAYTSSDDIWVMNADGAGQTNLTGAAGTADSEPAWSPDGTKIAFTKLVPGFQYEIAVMNADGTGQAVVASHVEPDIGPDWQPLGAAPPPPPPPASADLALTKTAPAAGVVGNTLTYALTVANAGPNLAGDVSVTDTLPSGVAFVSATATQGACSGSTTVVCALGSVANGSTGTVTIVVTPSAAGEITNTASVTSSTGDPSAGNNTASVTTPIQPPPPPPPPPPASAELELTKTAPLTGLVERDLTYVLNVYNAGPDSAADVNVTDTLPTGMTFVSASSTQGTCSGTTTITCALGSVIGGVVAKMTIVVNPAAAGEYTNTASVSSATDDPIPDSNTDSATTTIEQSADLRLTKSARSATQVAPQAGSDLVYTLEVTNAGPNDANQVLVNDALPDDVTFVSASAGSGSCSGKVLVQCSFESLAVGATARATIVVTPSAVSEITNSATVESNTRDPNPNNNTGSVTNQIRPPAPVEEGDFFVGTVTESDLRESGSIMRVRSGAARTFCKSPFSGPDRWEAPHDVLVDSEGRVAFLAAVGPVSPSGIGEYGLLRCNRAGETAEKLAIFGVAPSAGRGYPVPFPNVRTVSGVGGLHLARKRSVAIDDLLAGGKPKTTSADIYGLVLSTPSAFMSLRYLPATLEWEDGAQIVAPPGLLGSGFIPDATYYGGATYSSLENVVGRDREPFRFNLQGTIGGVSFGLQIGLFGGYSEVGGGLSQGSFEEVASTSFVHDNVLIANEDGGCPPGSVPTAVPRSGGFYNGPAGFGEIAEQRNFGLVVTSNSIAAGGGPYLTQYGGVLLDDNPFNDGEALFKRPELNCNVQRKLDFEPILPHFDPAPPEGEPANNDVTRLVSGTDGLFGTQRFNGRVVQIRAGERLSTIASGLIRPTGIAVYPANVPPGANVEIVIRIDSPVDVVIADSSGKRIGVDGSGNVVNDFGVNGYVGPPGEPRLLAIRDPAPGGLSIDTIGTGTGPYAVHVYSLDADELGEHIVARGTATPGSTSEHDFTLAADGSVAFVAPADTTPPVIARTVLPEPNAAGWHRQDVSVSWSVADPESGIASSSGCGVSTLVAETAGATVTCTATNGAGLTSSHSVTIRIDKTAPEATVQFDPQTSDLRVGARDGLSGPVSGPASYTVLSGGDDDDDDEEKQRRRYLVRDQAGNERALVLEVEREDDGEELTARLEGFGENKLTVEAEDDDELEQKIELGKGKTKVTVRASYDGSKTKITSEQNGKKTNVTKPGLVLLRLVTNGGVLSVEH